MVLTASANETALKIAVRRIRSALAAGGDRLPGGDPELAGKRKHSLLFRYLA
jgi:hypothetical protein